MLLLRSEDISDVPVHKRSTRLIWQDYSLFPFLNVRKNIEFGLTLKRHDKSDVRGKLKSRRRKFNWAIFCPAASAS